MSEDKTPDLYENPYHPFEETGQHKAFQAGWEARREQLPRTANPYNLSQVELSLAWLDGWTAAREQERDADADTWRSVIGRRSGAGREVSVS